MPAGDAVQALIDKQAITEQLVTYCRAADRIDVPLLRSVFHPDSSADYGAMYQGTGPGFADFLEEAHRGLVAHSHHIGNVLITLDGDTASSESYVSVRLRGRSGDRHTDVLAYGRYLDRWERRDDDVWRIAYRRYLHTFDETRSIDAVLYETAGSRDHDDPSYDHLRPRGRRCER